MTSLTQISPEMKEALFSTKSILLGNEAHEDGLFTQEVHLFMHCHLKGYDRDGEGENMDRSFFDKYGAPVKIGKLK